MVVLGRHTSSEHCSRVNISAVATCSTLGSTSRAQFWSHMTTSVLVYASFTGCQSLNKSHISSVFSSTTQQLDEHQSTLLTSFSQLPPLHRRLRCEPRVVKIMSCHGQIKDSQFEHFPLLHLARAWNQLSTHLKMTQLTSAFLRGLKTFLFHRTYGSE